ncbi:MAG: geranylgeranylglyceryl/heptaprenylglyceryl phosphate synthase [Candidatus Marinimicrobia bacterium]|jgi:phosphoglycerol geranylgeranyltransferase|nr:geranylgeranylglyceryl/heptaprenylglyceryl phosphate synthase [Candidatus Neomarinimicrobiota bacterium]
MKIFQKLLRIKEEKGAGYFVLIDPDSFSTEDVEKKVNKICNSGVDMILVGGSLLMTNGYNEKIELIKKYSSIPMILFPGSTSQIRNEFDAVLFLSLISSRNPELIIGKQVISAPILKAMNMEVISTAYMLIESGKVTTAEFMSNSKPIPSNKSDIAVAHAIAAEMLGFKMIYLEAGSGADNPVPNKMISMVKKQVNIPIIVGGGITKPEIAKQKVIAGADFIVTGNILEKEGNSHLMSKFADLIHK